MMDQSNISKAHNKLMASCIADLKAYCEKLQEQAQANSLKVGKEQVNLPKRLLENLPKMYLNTILTTCQFEGAETVLEGGTTWMITGDIDALWLRDSACQVMQYLPVVKTSQAVDRLIGGLLLRQWQCLLYDPYANAFNHTENDRHWDRDIPPAKPGCWEQKFELDSLCYPFMLADLYEQASGNLQTFTRPEFLQAIAKMLDVFETEIAHAKRSNYSFYRPGAPKQDYLANEGKGADFVETDLLWCGFRPSDDACQLPFFIPGNLMACQTLKQLSKLLTRLEQKEVIKELAVSQKLKERMQTLVAKIESAVAKHGKIKVDFGNVKTAWQSSPEKTCQSEKQLAAPPKNLVSVYAYEVDGKGNYLCMDDANVPSLLSLPYLGVLEKSDPLYLATREVSLSFLNPYFYRSGASRERLAPRINQATDCLALDAKDCQRNHELIEDLAKADYRETAAILPSAFLGLGSPHTFSDRVWPIGIAMQALTSLDKNEIQACLNMLANCDADTELMHESFLVSDPKDFTRAWFAWANSLVAELLRRLITAEM